jgi:hypothetical protein
MKKGALFIFLLAFLCIGQGFGPKIIKGPVQIGPVPNADPVTTIPGLLHRWRYFTVTNQLPVTNWVDDICGDSMWQTNLDFAPTVTNNVGLYFANRYDADPAFCHTNFLRCTNVTAYLTHDDSSFFFVGNKFNAGNSGDETKVWTDGFYGYRLTDNSGLGQLWQIRYASTYIELASGGPQQTNNVFAWLHIGSPHNSFYTNGVLSVTNTGTGSSLDLTLLGSAGVSPSRYGFSGYVCELNVWTNTGSFTDANVSNLFWYATNTYGPY